MFKTRFISMLALLCLTVSGAWADDYLYLVVDGTSATVMYGDKGSNPYYGPDEDDEYGWLVAEDSYSGKKTLTTVTIDASCQNYTGTTLEHFFDFWSGLTTINNLENLNTSEVTNMKRMFTGCSSLTSFDLSGLNTAKVTSMRQLFTSVPVETLDLSGFNTANVTDMYCMFYNCTNLETIYVGDGWSTASVTDGTLMFGKCTNLPGFDSGNVTHAMAKLTTDGGYLTYKAPESEPSTYTVTLKEGTEDATSWTIAPAEATTTGVAAGTEVKATYSGTKRVKSVKAVKKEAPATGTDLSMVDCAGNARDKQWTANCYMVHTAGDYKLPLVYGNAIKAGATNAAAYTGVENANTTLTFPRHDGNAITAPWIKDNNITVTSAELLWQDAQGLVTAVGISGDYLTLTVGTDAATQEGNALVAAKDADGTIVWSWHIWVTKQTFATLTEVNTGSHTYQLTPVNLGWVGDATSATGGYNTYYQWGRKDAFIPSNPISSTGTNDTNHTVYNINNNDVTMTAFTHTDDNSVTIGGNIQNPTVHYRNTSTSGPCNTTYYNMWDAQQTSTDINTATATVKTVYDPCPPGFCVPTIGLYNYIKIQNRPTWNTGYTYPATNVVFFPASGLRNSDSGDLYGVGTYGYCLSATPNGGARGRSFYFYSGSWTLSNGYRTSGYPVRAVAE